MAQIVRSLIPDVSKDPWSVRAEVRPERTAGRLYLQLYGEDGQPRTDLPLSVLLQSAPPDAAPRRDEELGLRRRGEHYEAALPPTGGLLRAVLSADEATFGERKFVIATPRPPELRKRGADRELLLTLVGGAQARLDGPPQSVLRAPRVTSREEKPWRLPFLLLAAILPTAVNAIVSST